MNFVTCPKQGLEMEAIVLNRVGFLEYFCPKQGQDFKPSAATLPPNMSQVPPPPENASGTEFPFWGMQLQRVIEFVHFRT